MTTFPYDQPPPIPGTAPTPIAPALASARPARGGIRRSIIAWGVLATAALGYLTLAALRPDMIAAYVPSAPKPGTAEPNEGQRATTGAVAELTQIRDSVTQLQTDIGQLKSDVAETSSQNKELSARLAALAEQSSKVAAVSGAMSAPSTVPSAQTDNPVAVAAAAAAAPLPPAELRLEPVPVNGPVASKPIAQQAATIVATQAIAAASMTPKAPAAPTAPDALPKAAEMIVLNAPPAAVPPKPIAAGSAPPAKSLETGSVKAADAAAPFAVPVTAKAPAKPVGLQIASAPSLDALRLSWSLLSETHADSLKNLEPRYSTGVDANGLTYNLMAGPVKSAADAKKMCKALTAKAIACKVVGEFSGEAL